MYYAVFFDVFVGVLTLELLALALINFNKVKEEVSKVRALVVDSDSHLDIVQHKLDAFYSVFYDFTSKRDKKAKKSKK
jgi:hypothetical protein